MLNTGTLVSSLLADLEDLMSVIDFWIHLSLQRQYTSDKIIRITIDKIESNKLVTIPLVFS